MNWYLLGIILYFIFLMGTLIFVSMYYNLYPKNLKINFWVQSKAESFIQSFGRNFSFTMLGLVALNLLIGIVLIVLIIIAAIQGT